MSEYSVSPASLAYAELASEPGASRLHLDEISPEFFIGSDPTDRPGFSSAWDWFGSDEFVTYRGLDGLTVALRLLHSPTLPWVRKREP